MKLKTENIKNYDAFLESNRKRVNRYLNIVLWFFILTGPAIAIGIRTGVYTDIDYSTCINISLVMFIVSLAHFALTKKWPKSIYTSCFALLALNLLLVYMSYDHVAINLTWFIVPMLSILLCEIRVYFVFVGINYILMLQATYLTAPYFINPNSEYDSFALTFANRVGGYTVEMVIMCVGGYAILYLATNYFRTLIEKYKDLRKHEEKIEEHTKIMDSMAGIYDNANMIDFERMTERNIASGDKGEMKIDLSIQDHTSVTRSMFDSIVNDQLKDFIKFTDITTVQKRLENKKAISGEFIDILKGWFRAQYIVLNTDESGFPTRVIFTSQNIDNEKRREEHLIRIAMTDELTRLYNRRCYEEDIAAHKARGLEKDLSIFSIDVNGLKTANDTKGHAAGDELIKGAADCLVVITGSKGKVYRTGGDEFVAIINTDDCEKIKSQMKAKAAAWHGVYSEKLAISIGFASVADNQEATMEDLEKIADQMMYEDKAAYYSQNGIDRRRR